MPLLLLIPPTSEPVLLAEAKAHLRLTVSDDDSYLSSLVTAARRMIEARHGLALMPQAWALFADAWPEDGIFQIPLWPVQAVDSLETFSADDLAATIDPAHYLLDAASRPARVALRQGRMFAPPGRRINGLKLSFTAGFDVVPQEIKQALLIVAADWYQNRGDEAGGTLPAAALEALAAYRNTRLA